MGDVTIPRGFRRRLGARLGTHRGKERAVGRRREAKKERPITAVPSSSLPVDMSSEVTLCGKSLFKDEVSQKMSEAFTVCSHKRLFVCLLQSCGSELRVWDLPGW